MVGCAIIFCFVSLSLFAGDAKDTKNAFENKKPIGDGKNLRFGPMPQGVRNAFEKKKQELKDIVDRIAKLRGHATSIDWGDGTPRSSLTVTNVVARVRWCEDVARPTPPTTTAEVGSDSGAEHHIRKVIDATTPNLTAQAATVPVAEQGDIRRPQQPSPDEIQKANKLVAEYNSKREAYALEKPNGNYFASLPRFAVDPIELKTNSLLDQQVPSKRDAAAAGGESIGIGQIGRGGKYVVWVYKSEGGQWVKQPERTLNTDDAKAATDYVDQVSAVQGWMATTNVPEDLYMHRKLPGRMKSGQLSGKTKSGNK
jgi:hypothetical protein